MFVVIFDHLSLTDPYSVGPFPTMQHAQAYAATDPDLSTHGATGKSFIVTELNAPATYTLQPDCLTEDEHRRAEQEGWSIFDRADGHAYIERIDELDLLPDDVSAYPLARRMGLMISRQGRVLGKVKPMSTPIPQPDLGPLIQALDDLKKSINSA